MQTQRLTDRQVNNRLITVHTTSSGTIRVTGGSSDIAINGETVNGACITKIWWGVSRNLISNAQSWTITRNSNTLLVLPHSGQLFFGLDNLIQIDKAYDIVATLNGPSGFLMMELQKE